ncbi:MAG: hypothetical protein ACI83O_000451 [Patescibacteria group bacterium]|jgi:hypothetical protein
MNTKKGATDVTNVMIGLVIAVVVLVAVLFWFSDGFNTAKDETSVFSRSENSRAIAACNALCTGLFGSDNSYAFNVEKLDVVLPGTDKVVPSTCAQIANIPEFGIKCTSVS